ncbi:AbrB family transcriptional regulator [Candidatus Bathycorpusculum sp.]|uniref:AbrB family transcriptional regulator n=1 Tax=Candidatus Bathycorpusculum sp. TaxID=2994959 RepID=UPI00281C1B53|nr:AbrB family transcriptional regulator [Candidatus Termitimicrobium sp.]MCL2432654.1 AbrB family transcriptional regulator [Candidatus Termitimicrobium sp.]
MIEWVLITPAHSRTKSKRVTIPEAIITALDLTDGDEIGWEIVAESEGVLGAKLHFRKKAK